MRGIAVLGILAVNIAGFAGPLIGTETPSWPVRAGMLDERLFAFVFLVFEGKMRAIFSMLFGASMLLFVAAAERRGRDGDLWQLRRLGWLTVFGYLHYLLFWWGDILFLYAVAGGIALALRRLKPASLATVALMTFVCWHGWSMVQSLPAIVAEEQVRAGTADRPTRDFIAKADEALLRARTDDFRQSRLGFAALAIDKAVHRPGWPLSVTLYTLGETVPLMMLGMALLESGFFAGQWRRRTLVLMAIAGLGSGGVLTGLILGWAWPRHFPPIAMREIVSYWAGLPHLLMGLGMMAAFMLVGRPFLASRTGKRFAAAGRMAFTNYLATTFAMTALFYGWGFGLFGRLDGAAQAGVVLAWWAVLLAWSKPWLARFRQGPLEWLWRSLVEMRRLPFRR